MKTEDIPLAMRAMGALVTQHQITQLIRKYDPDRTGKVVEQDYMRMMAEVKDTPDNLEMVKNAFSSFDKQGRGMLSSEEMKHVLTRIGDTLTPDEMNNFLSLIDYAGEGIVNMNDLLTLFQSQVGGDMQRMN
jgi:calmodulin